MKVSSIRILVPIVTHINGTTKTAGNISSHLEKTCAAVKPNATAALKTTPIIISSYLEKMFKLFMIYAAIAAYIITSAETPKAIQAISFFVFFFSKNSETL